MAGVLQERHEEVASLDRNSRECMVKLREAQPTNGQPENFINKSASALRLSDAMYHPSQFTL